MTPDGHHPPTLDKAAIREPSTIVGSGGGERQRHWFECRHEQGIFARMMADLAADHGEEKTVMIDATYLKAHRTAPGLGIKGGRGRLTG